MADSLARKLNLSILLAEDLEADGLPLPTELTHDQLAAMSEAQIRAHYSSPTAAVVAQTQHQHEADGADVAPASDEQLQQLRARFPPQGDSVAYTAWFPSLATSRRHVLAPPAPSAVVLAFHSSGNAEDMFTSEGTGSRRTPSPLLAACQAHSWLMLAPQLPGRGQRLREPPLATLQDVAQALLPLVAPAIIAAGGRYAILAHSVGAWAAWELVLLLRQAGLPEPAAACLSAMPWPHIPLEQRPWRQQRLLSEEEFKAECRGWDINEAAFGEGMWRMLQPMLRADFSLFDEYSPSASSAPAGAFGGCRLRLFWGARDRRVTEAMVKEWRAYSTCADAAVVRVDGHHLWPVADPAAKAAWLAQVAAEFKAALLGSERELGR